MAYWAVTHTHKEYLEADTERDAIGQMVNLLLSIDTDDDCEANEIDEQTYNTRG
jgi:hypothetical protein